MLLSWGLINGHNELREANGLHLVQRRMDRRVQHRPGDVACGSFFFVQVVHAMDIVKLAMGNPCEFEIEIFDCLGSAWNVPSVAYVDSRTEVFLFCDSNPHGFIENS